VRHNHRRKGRGRALDIAPHVNKPQRSA